MNDLVKNGIAPGKNPMGLPTTALYASCIKTGEQKTKLELASPAQTTEVAFRNRLKDLKIGLNCIISPLET